MVLTASGLVFTGETGGYFTTRWTRNRGKMLVHFPLADSVQGGVITYSAHNAQYVAGVSGNGAVINKKSFPGVVGGNPKVTVFSLPTR